MIDSTSLLLNYNKLDRVAIVGNGPIYKNYSKEIDSCDIVVRINNFKIVDTVGSRVDVCYINNPNLIKEISKFGCKIILANKDINKDYKLDIYYISSEKYNNYLNEVDIFSEKRLMTGTIAILDFLQLNCKIYLFGFDFFSNGVKYYFDNDKITTKQHLDEFHQINLEYKFIKKQKKIVIY